MSCVLTRLFAVSSAAVERFSVRHLVCGVIRVVRAVLLVCFYRFSGLSLIQRCFDQGRGVVDCGDRDIVYM